MNYINNNYSVRITTLAFILFAGLFAYACEDDDTGLDTDIIAPEVTSTSPASGDMDVPTSSTISAAFSEDMDSSTINDNSFMVNIGDSLSTPGNISLSNSNTAIFTPDTELEANTEYTVTLTTQIQDLNGNNLDEDYQWSFTTAATDTATGDTSFVIQDIP